MNKIFEKVYDDIDFINVISDVINNPTVQSMKQYKQHFNISCFEHCLLSSYYCYKICKKLHLDYASCSRAAMLHDLFLYDWHEHHPDYKGFHAFKHPKIAYENAIKIFDLNKKETDIILKHMWPITFFQFPKYAESFILTLVDKYCAFCETLHSENRNQKDKLNIWKKIAQRRSYIFR